MPALGFDFDRSLNAPPSEVRRAVGEALREAGFQVTAEQLTRIEAKRGSRILGGALMPTRMLPILASFDIVPNGQGCAISAHLADQHINLGGKAWGWNQTYRGLCGEVQEAIDRRLASLDPAAAAAFEPARFWSKGGEVAVLEQAQTAGARAGGTVIDKASGVLSGGSKPRSPSVWKGIDSVTFDSSKGCAVLSMAETQAHLGVAVMIASQPGAMPPNLTRDIEVFAARVEQGLTIAGGQAVTVEVGDTELPVFEFLHQQVRIREGLPVRTLHTCKACHNQKLTNEDFERLQTRNKHLRSLVGGVGTTISSGGIKPFMVIGQVFNLKKLDPDYVCPQCQGLEAEEQIVTFCPGCGGMRSEAALKKCGKCGFDFRSRLTPETFWLTPEAAAEAAAADEAAAAETAAADESVADGMAAESVAAGGPAPWVPTGGAEIGALRVDRAATIAPEAPTGAGQWSFCPACGARLSVEFDFCPACGGRV